MNNNIKRIPIYNENNQESASIFQYIKDKKVVGEIQGRYFESLDSYILSEFEVDSEHHGKGYGTFLLKIACLHYQQDESNIPILIYVRQNNKIARKIIEKNEFEIEKEYINGNKEHIVIYKHKN